ncbi:DUF1636 family protein [Acidimangrovimonas pyrenivorans]|uniref:DUF1636 family protein n=1 Tax=Acidimangrovimonas pyrenivorans TaxID=2030798 RepID=A0ABV7AI72_9RHOB
MGGVTLTICTTCRRVAGGDPEEAAPRPGARLCAAIAERGLPEGVELRTAECLSACSRGCTMALSGPGRWSYVYGSMDPERDAEAILDGAARYAASADGIVPWRERPQIFRKRSIARIPPQN